MEDDEYAHSKAATVRRYAKRAVYDRATINAILDENIVAHVGFVSEGAPLVIPMLYAREGDSLLIHGSCAGRMMKLLGGGSRVCLSIASVTGLVLAYTPYSNDNQYRSAVLFGTGKIIDDETEKMEALRVLTNKLIPGRWEKAGVIDGREPNAMEVKSTCIVRVAIEEASAKVREGGPMEEKKDLEDPALANVWTGVIPIRQGYDVASAVPFKEGLVMPEYIKKLT